MRAPATAPIGAAELLPIDQPGSEPSGLCATRRIVLLAGDTPVVESDDLHKVLEYLADWAGREVMVVTGPADAVMARTSTVLGILKPAREVRQPGPRHDVLGREWRLPVGDPDDATFDGFWIVERLFWSARWEEGDTAPDYVLSFGAIEVRVRLIPEDSAFAGPGTRGSSRE